MPCITQGRWISAFVATTEILDRISCCKTASAPGDPPRPERQLCPRACGFNAGTMVCEVKVENGEDIFFLANAGFCAFAKFMLAPLWIPTFVGMTDKCNWLSYGQSAIRPTGPEAGIQWIQTMRPTWSYDPRARGRTPSSSTPERTRDVSLAAWNNSPTPIPKNFGRPKSTSAQQRDTKRAAAT